MPLEVTYINDLRDNTTGLLRTHHYLNVSTCVMGPKQWRDLPITVPHLHGGHTPAAYDGHPDYGFWPGETRVYKYPNNQDAALIWYHDHGMGITRLNVYMGMAGAYVITSPEESAYNLPSGVKDIPLIFQDRILQADGGLWYPSQFTVDFFGDIMLVNGVAFPRLNVTRTSYRFRILNGCNSRVLNITIPDHVMTVVAGEVGYLSRPVNTTWLQLGPAERVIVVVDFSKDVAGAEIVVRNNRVVRSALDLPDLLKIVVQGPLVTPAYRLPTTLAPPLPVATVDSASLIRSFEVQYEFDECSRVKWNINGLPYRTITEIVILGDTELWEFGEFWGVFDICA